MQRIISISRFGRLLGARSALRQQAAAWPILRNVHDAGQSAVEGPTAADIKKNVPELWVRKMKTFFAFHDRNRDGILSVEDYRMYETLGVSNALAMNINQGQIEKFKTAMSELLDHFES